MSEMALARVEARHDVHRRRQPSNSFNLAADSLSPFVGRSIATRRVHELISRVAPTDSPVLICGESGTGKGLAARHIHQASARAGAPYIAIDCAAFTKTRLVSELFGRERGAFNGAQVDKKGRFELADGGTLFLEEVDALTPGLQAKLLRVLEEQQLERVGGLRPIRIDVRLIAATSGDLEAAVNRGAFRLDLYYRLKVISLTMPPLREHPEDIAYLVDLFVHELGRCNGHCVTRVSSEALSLLMRHTWPGYIRELRNAIEHACVTGTTDVILPHDLPEDIICMPRSSIASQRRRSEALCHVCRKHAPNDRPKSPAQTKAGRRANDEALPAVKGPGETSDQSAAELSANSMDTVTLPPGTRSESAEGITWHRNMIGKTLSHYHTLVKVGEGGMGVVYKARDTHLDRFVAVKVLPPEKVADPECKRRFVQEAKAASALNHPNIITIYDIDSADGVDFIAMEYVEGKTLDALIPPKGMRLDEALKHSVQIADALAATHEAGIVHRDLKPSNIMVTSKGQVKVLDFGVAKLAETGLVGHGANTLAEKPINDTGRLVGTVSYMSPEQAEGKTVDARSDIFSFGSVLYEMLTGRRPFRRDTRALTVAAILHLEPPPLPPKTPKELERIISRCLRKDPKRRFQYMKDLKVELAELKEEWDSRTLEAVPRPKPKSRWAWPVVAIAVVLAAAGWLWFSRARPGEPEASLKAVHLISCSGSETLLSSSPHGNNLASIVHANRKRRWGHDSLSGSIVVRGTPAESPSLRLVASRRRTWNPRGAARGHPILHYR